MSTSVGINAVVSSFCDQFQSGNVEKVYDQSSLKYLALKKAQTKKWPRPKKLEAIAVNTVCKADCSISCTGWKNQNLQLFSSTSQSVSLGDQCQNCHHKLSAHVSHLKNAKEEDINRLLEIIVDMDYLHHCVSSEGDKETREVYYFLLQLLRDCVHQVAKPIDKLVRRLKSSPPFESPNLAKAIKNFVCYKFGQSPDEEWKTMCDLAKLFLIQFNKLALEKFSNFVLRCQNCSKEELSMYKFNYTRWLCFCSVPALCSSLPHYEPSMIFGRTLLKSCFKKMKEYILDKKEKYKKAHAIDKHNQLNRFLSMLEAEVYGTNSPIWHLEFKQSEWMSRSRNVLSAEKSTYSSQLKPVEKQKIYSNQSSETRSNICASTSAVPQKTSPNVITQSHREKRPAEPLTKDSKRKRSKGKKEPAKPLTKDSKGKGSKREKERAEPLIKDSKRKSSKGKKEPAKPLKMDFKGRSSKGKKEPAEPLAKDSKRKSSKAVTKATEAQPLTDSKTRKIGERKIEKSPVSESRRRKTKGVKKLVAKPSASHLRKKKTKVENKYEKLRAQVPKERKNKDKTKLIEKLSDSKRRNSKRILEGKVAELVPQRYILRHKINEPLSSEPKLCFKEGGSLIIRLHFPGCNTIPIPGDIPMNHIYEAFSAIKKPVQHINNPYICSIPFSDKFSSMDETVCVKELQGKVEFHVICNSLKNWLNDECITYLISLYNILAHEFVSVTPEFIIRLLFDPRHKILIAIDHKKVVGGICFRMFPSRGFSEIELCAVAADEKDKGYGTQLMNHLKDYHIKYGYLHLLTYASNSAVKFFIKQGFSTSLQLPLWVYDGYVKVCEGAVLMGCKLHPRIIYTRFKYGMRIQKELIKYIAKKHNEEALRNQEESIIKQEAYLKRQEECLKKQEEILRRPSDVRRISFKIAGRKRSRISSTSSISNKSNGENLIHQEKKPDCALAMILSQVKNHPCAGPFLRPVSEIEVPGYYTYIKYPMDLGTMTDRLKNNYYCNMKLFVADMRRIFKNCRLFNSEDSEYYESTDILEEFFDSILQEANIF